MNDERTTGRAVSPKPPRRARGVKPRGAAPLYGDCAPYHPTTAGIRRTSGCGGSRKSGFTLIELLTVIVIIALLVGLLFPAVSAVRRFADKNKAASRALHMAQAIEAYRNAYSAFPGQTQGNTDRTYDNIALGHSNVITALTNNPRLIIFSQIAEGITNDVYVDTWDRPYIIGVDENGDGYVGMTSTYSVGVTFLTNVRARVAVASWGRIPADPRERIVSWIR